MFPDVPRPRLTPLGSTLLLVLVLLLVGLALAALGGAVLLPQGSAVLLVVLAALGFLALQVVLFRALGLRSRADDSPEAGPDEGESDDEDDWRSWRG